MKSSCWALLLSLLSLATAGCSGPFSSLPPEERERAQALIRRTSPAVIQLNRGGSRGSGVIVDPRGWVLTAGHCVSGIDEQGRLADGRELELLLVWRSPHDDWALLRIVEPAGPFPFAEIGGAPPAPESRVVGLGYSSGGSSPEPFVGRVLGGGVNMPRGFLREGVASWNALLHSAPSRPGDSGGPILDLEGRVIGIVSAGNELLGVAVPALRLAEPLEKLQPYSHIVEVGAALGGAADAETRLRVTGDSAPAPPETFTEELDWLLDGLIELQVQRGEERAELEAGARSARQEALARFERDPDLDRLPLFRSIWAGFLGR